MVRSAMIGARVRRKEDPRLITGSSMYVDDLQLAGMAHVAFVRSPFAHAKINGIDTSAATAAPGVIAVYTNADLLKIAHPLSTGGGEGTPLAEGDAMPGELAGVEELPAGDIPTPGLDPLAGDRVRWVGETVVAVLAETKAQAEDAAALVEVDYEELPAVVGIRNALKPDAPRIWDGIARNLGINYSKKQGDPDGAFANAAVTVKQKIVSNRVFPLSMEGRAAAAAPDPLTGGLTVWSSTQAPHWNRRALAGLLDLPESSVRVIAPEVGGGFGAKIGVYREELVTAALAKQHKRPVKWIESRSENLLSMNHGRCQEAEIELAADANGKVSAIRLTVWGEAGAYAMGLDMPPITTMMSTGCYDIPNVDLKAYAIYTNTMAIGAYRGAGRPEAAYYIERAMDLLAHQMGKDPAEVRRVNFLRPEQFPYESPAGFKYDTGEYEKNLDKALEVSDYAGLRSWQASERANGRLIGIGVASYVEICGFGPWESSTVRVEPSGAVSVFTGISPHGQGQETTFAQMIADDLGADFEQVVVHHGDTASNPQGNGTMGSRGLVVGGSALKISAGKIREKCRAIAANMLEVATEDIELVDGKYQVAGAPDRFTMLADIAGRAYAGGLPDDIDAGLVSTDFFSPKGETYPFGTHVAVVEVLAETGQVKVLKFFSTDDCGVVISPILVDGQVHGGLAQGIGQALFEEVVYDDNGQLLTGSLMDYAVPHADTFPMFELNRTVTPSPLNPLGAKGIGEAATIGSTPATVNAVMDALAPKGISHLDMPLSAPKLWAALNG